jgi:ABC-type branched-subunit amino acid transport system substrate-binding protein
MTLGTPNSPGAPPIPGEQPVATRRVALLLPLTGPLGERGQAMLKAAQLAFNQPGAPVLDVRDTTGNPTGAAAAAQQALAEHDTLMVGPLTNTETASVAPLARAAGVPVLALTSDSTQAQPGVWVLGLTPAQQVTRVVAAMTASSGGFQPVRFAALVPENDLGRAMAAALTDALAASGATAAPVIQRYGAGMPAMNAAVRDISDYANRRAPLEADISAARARGDVAGRAEAAALANRPIPPAPFDALLLADTGAQLAQLATLLPYYDIEIPPIRVLGPALWASPSTRAGAGNVLNGAWYAAPDPADRAGFDRLFAERYNAPPGPLTDLAYDAASLARVAVEQGGDLGASLTRPEGFAGVDGLLGLLPDGRVRRGLAVFELRNGAPNMVQPAPHSFAPGS